MEEIVFENIRVQLLCDEIVRIEYAAQGKFCDENTLFVPDRSHFFSAQVAYTQKGHAICWGAYELSVPQNTSSLSGVTLKKNGKRVYTYKPLANSGELPALDKTPEVFALSDTPRLLLPEGGYCADRKGEYKAEENMQDIYLLLCGKSAKKLRKLYVELTGKCEMVRLSTLGGWNSKYYAYTEETAKQLILDYEKHDIPLDVMVIDTDWRSCEDGWGYDVNEKLFPDMEGFLAFAHAHGLEIMFNDHPEPVNGAQVFAPEEIAYRERSLQSLMEKGVDIWWYDRNWHTRLISPTSGIPSETLGLYLFTDITASFYKKQAKDAKIFRRPVVMGNVVNVVNGEYRGITDSASHRYSIQWTGDTESDFAALKQEIQTLIRCGANAIPYVNADCGGHMGDPDKEQFIRWMQFGTLSPVFRPHCTNSVKRTREPWLYDEETVDIVREYTNLRYRLLPIIYKNAYVAYETGEPIFKSLAYEYPHDKKAVQCTDEYMLGNDILIAPIVSSDSHNGASRSVYLPAGKWIDVFDGKVYTGGKTIGKTCSLREMPLFVRAGALLPLAYAAKNTKAQKWDNLVYDFYPCKQAQDSGYLYEDDTQTSTYKHGQFRKSAYEAKYCRDRNAYVVNLHAAQGSFAGERAFTKRNIMIKYHLSEGAEPVKKITVNGEEIALTVTKNNSKIFPLHTDKASACSDVICVSAETDVTKEYEIRFYL